MGHHDARIDDYIAGSAGFAQPILRQLREAVHATCPEVEESLKWGMPSFGYRGKILCSMAAFKQHASFGFWQGARVLGEDPAKPAKASPGARRAVERKGGEGMGQFGRLKQLSDLPDPHALAGFMMQAMKLIDDGVARPSGKVAATRAPLVVPDDLATALKTHAEARATFDRFPPGQQREYIDWITGAKRDDTRQRRLVQAIEWLGEGKPRNWKYMNC